MVNLGRQQWLSNSLKMTVGGKCAHHRKNNRSKVSDTSVYITNKQNRQKTTTEAVASNCFLTGSGCFCLFDCCKAYKDTLTYGTMDANGASHPNPRYAIPQSTLACLTFLSWTTTTAAVIWQPNVRRLIKKRVIFSLWLSHLLRVHLMCDRMDENGTR